MPLTPQEIKEKQQARLLLDRLDQRERIEKMEEMVKAWQPLIGKYFKYRNSYGSNTTPWWMYVEIVGLKHDMFFVKPTMITYQAPPNRLEIIMESHSFDPHNFDGTGSYIPISRAEFNRGKANIVKKLIEVKS